MKQYHDLLRHILENGESHDDRTGVGTISVFGYQVRFDLRDGFPLMTTKKIPFRWIAEELFWFLRGSTDEWELEKVGVDIWEEWATYEQTSKFGREPGDLGPIYGRLWRGFPVGSLENPPEEGVYFSHADLTPFLSVDQIASLLREIEENPNSRRLIVSGWHPYYQALVALPPCHTLWQIKVHPNRFMSLHLYARSIDSFLGLPFNIASYALLLTLIGHVTNYTPKELVISFGDLHIYKNHIDQVKLQLSREPRSLPRVSIVNDVWSEPASALDKLLSLNYTNLALINYNPHPAIKAEVAI